MLRRFLRRRALLYQRRASLGSGPSAGDPDCCGNGCVNGRCCHAAGHECTDGSACCGGSCVNGGCCAAIGAPCNGHGDCCDVGTNSCVGGVCQRNPCDGSSCDDGNPCTNDTCDPAIGCQHDPLADGTPCTVNGANGTCQSGACGSQDRCQTTLEAAGCAYSGVWECPIGDDLAGKDLHGCDLRGATLSDDLARTNLSGADLTDATLQGFLLIGANLSGAVLVNANLGGADVTRADLSGADLTGAVLTGGVVWSNTTCPDDTNSDANGGTCCGHLNGAVPAGCR